MAYKLGDELCFPDPSEADKNGLLAFGGDLSAKRLIKAYKSGIFPWPHKNFPLLWFSPDPRAVLYPDDFCLARSLKHSLKRYEIRADANFSQVISMCAEVRKQSTWINAQMIEAYNELFRLGFAHSVESYDEDGKLVGGLYGVCAGKVFCGESMFTLKKDASKAALYWLCREVSQRKGIIDCQVINPHLSSLGAVEISRDSFLQTLAFLGNEPSIF